MASAGVLYHKFVKGDTLRIGVADGVCRGGDWEFAGDADQIWYPPLPACNCPECRKLPVSERQNGARMVGGRIRSYLYAMLAAHRPDHPMGLSELENVYCMIEQLMCEGVIRLSPCGFDTLSGKTGVMISSMKVKGGD